MIERAFIKQNLREFEIQEYISKNLKRVGHSYTKLQRTPLGEKIIIHASRPGLVVGRKGENIKKLTETLKKKFKLENPQIELSEVEDINLDAQIVSERITNSLEKFGISKFKGIVHKTMEDVMTSGALGVEIIISGKVPSTRAKNWRFYQGYLKKCGDIALTDVKKALGEAHVKTGTIGVKVSIMPPNIKLPDHVKLMSEIKKEEEARDLASKDKKEVKKDTKPPYRRPRDKRPVRK